MSHLSDDNTIIHGLWIDGELSPLEFLSILSAQRMGHTYYLWTYNPDIRVPEGTRVKDAAEILPKDRVFRKRNHDPNVSVGKGSYGTFSDIFRYKLLYEYGGWWLDADVTLLKPLQVAEPYFFREHNHLAMVGNAMKVPPRDPLMKAVYEETSARCDQNTEEWLLTNKILNRHVEESGLSRYIFADVSNPDIWPITSRFILKNRPVPEQWLFVHWQNEEWRCRNMDKQNVNPYGTLGKMMESYGLKPAPKTLWKYLRSRF